jgi:hypothetical protein
MYQPFFKQDNYRYNYFENIHQNLDQSVEPVPIDRWSKFAIDKTFPGIIRTVVYRYFGFNAYRNNHISEKPTTGKGFKQMIESEETEFTKSNFVKKVQESYDVISNNQRGSEYYKKEITRRANNLWDDWESDPEDFHNSNLTEDEVLRALIDIGDQTKIVLEKQLMNIAEVIQE